MPDVKDKNKEALDFVRKQFNELKDDSLENYQGKWAILGFRTDGYSELAHAPGSTTVITFDSEAEAQAMVDEIVASLAANIPGQCVHWLDKTTGPEEFSHAFPIPHGGDNG